MSIPYSRVYAATVESGTNNCVELPAPPRGILRRLVVQQVSGGLDGCEFDLYSKLAACPGASEDSECAVDPLLASSVYQVIPTQTMGSGSDLEELYDCEYAYENQDWDCQYRRNTTVYLRILPLGSGIKVFHIGYSITSDMG